MAKIIAFSKKHFWQIAATVFLVALFLQDRLIIKSVFWKDSFIEYQSIAIYPFYVLVVLYLLGLVIYKVKKREQFNLGPRFVLVLVGLAFLVLLITGLLGIYPLISLFFLLKFVLGFFAYLVILNLKIKFSFWQVLLITLIVIEGVLGIGQMVLQRDLGLRLLVGEPVLDPSEFGVGVIEWEGHRSLRAYGNFAHPNIFGGIMATGLVLLTSFYLSAKKKLRKFQQREKDWFFFFAFLVIYLGLFFSFSRSAWLPLAIIVCIFAVGVIIYRFRHSFSPDLKNKVLKINLAFLICLILSVALFSAPLSVRFNPEESQMERVIKSRGEYFKESFELSKFYWLKGTGAGNYVRGVFDKITSEDKGFLYQPVHNVPVLILIETGIIGVVLLLIWVIYWFWELFKRFKRGLKNSQFIVFAIMTLVLFILFFANLFDHYLWTSMIGFFLVWIFVGLGMKGTGDHF